MELFKAKFLQYGKSRFSCYIEINSNTKECYVASSFKFTRYIDLEGQKIWVRKVSKKGSRYQYALFAVENNGDAILLDLPHINILIEKYAKETNGGKKIISIKKEQIIADNYRCDLVLDLGNGVIYIEAKAILGLNEVCIYPNMNEKRAYKQLEHIRALIKKGYKVFYWLVCLNPRNRIIELSKDDSEFLSLLYKCMEEGLLLGYSTLRCDVNGGFEIDSLRVLNGESDISLF